MRLSSEAEKHRVARWYDAAILYLSFEHGDKDWANKVESFESELFRSGISDPAQIEEFLQTSTYAMEQYLKSDKARRYVQFKEMSLGEMCAILHKLPDLDNL